jgi:hypothetical protein
MNFEFVQNSWIHIDPPIGGRLKIWESKERMELEKGMRVKEKKKYSVISRRVSSIWRAFWSDKTAVIFKIKSYFFCDWEKTFLPFGGPEENFPSFPKQKSVTKTTNMDGNFLLHKVKMKR